MIEELKKWLSKKDNSHEKLAKKMGYLSKSTIYNWISRNSIPAHAQKRLKRILKI